MANRDSEAWRKRQHDVLTALRGAASQDEFSRRAGIKYWRYVHLEQGKARLLGDEFWLLASVCAITPEALAQRLGYPANEAGGPSFAERLAAHNVSEEATRELLSDIDGRTLTPENAEAIARYVARDERDHPRPPRNRRRVQGC